MPEASETVTTTSIWPFLISRGHNAGFHEVLGPAFATRSPGWLMAESADEEPLGVSLRRPVVLHDTDYQLVYRRVMADGSWIDGEPTPLRDASSRRLRVIEGFLVEGTKQPIDVADGFAQGDRSIRTSIAAQTGQ